MTTADIKAVFFDVDGTLTSFTTHTVPQSTIDALHMLRERGVLIFICTGRAPSQFGVVADMMPVSFDGIVAFSVTPLALSSLLGILLCLASLVAVCFIVVRTLLYGDPVAGWPSLACIITFIGGVQLLCMGILGQYLSKAYLEVKNRPIYLVKEQGGEEDGRETV